MSNQLVKTLFACLFMMSPLVMKAQTDSTEIKEEQDLSSLLESEDEDNASGKKQYTTATFKTTRIANGHSIENVGKGILDIRINHRFGALNGGFNEFFGLDNAVTRLGADYGINDWLMIGIGRSTYMKEADGFVKARILRQTDDNSMPISLSYLGAASIQGVKLLENPAGTDYPFSNRLGYVNQLLIARKFSSAFSLQLMPTHVHNNFVMYANEPNDIFALGAGGRLKLSKRLALTAEYYYQLGDRMRDSRNSFTLGLDIETGGHVFQLMFSNSTGVSERSVIGGTTERWEKGQVHFGFNISRVFTVVRPKEFKDSRNKIW